MLRGAVLVPAPLNLAMTGRELVGASSHVRPVGINRSSSRVWPAATTITTASRTIQRGGRRDAEGRRGPHTVQMSARKERDLW